MTQSKLAGDFISRNMLSMIEDGKALPSLETLEYISNKLDVPAGYFFSDSDETEALYAKINAVSKAKALFREGQFSDCADVCRGVHFDDELSYLLAECELNIALEDMKRFTLASASEHLSLASSAASGCAYIHEDFTNTLEAYETFISFAAENIDIDRITSLSKRPTRLSPGIFVYLTCLYHIDRGEYESADATLSSLPCMSADQMKYLRAKQLARDFKFTAAIDMLTPLLDSENLGFISKYRICADIEGCYENKRDFESAYKYSTMKHHMLELFSK